MLDPDILIDLSFFQVVLNSWDFVGHLIIFFSGFLSLL
jgi:hypothetical protein